jgi:transposase
MVQLYDDGRGLSSSKIAARFGISTPTVLNILRKKGCVIRDHSVGELPFEELKARYEGNPEVTLLALATEYGVGYQTMRLGLSSVGCKFRPKAPEGNTRHKVWWEKQQAKLAELEQKAADAERKAAELRNKLGRPTEDPAVVERIRELKEQKLSWAKVTRIMNRETGTNRSKGAYRYLFEQSKLMTN